MSVTNTVEATKLTGAQARILGYLTSVGGNANAGSTTVEIMAGTGLSQNTVYTALRHGVPGVLECMHRSNVTGAKMYYVNMESLKSIAGVRLNGEDITKPKAFFDHPDFTRWASDIKGNVDKRASSMERLAEIVHSINHPPTDLSDDKLVDWYIVAGATLAGIALNMKEAK